MKKILLFSAVSLLALGLFSDCVINFNQNPTPNQNLIPSQNQFKPKLPGPPSYPQNQDQTQNQNQAQTQETWLVFQNSGAGYEIQHPQTWSLNNDDLKDVKISSPGTAQAIQKFMANPPQATEGPIEDISILYYVYLKDEPNMQMNNYKTLAEFAKSSAFYNMQETIFAGEKAWQGIQVGLVDRPVILMEHGGHLYEILSKDQTGLSAEDLQTQTKIINSFKFTF